MTAAAFSMMRFTWACGLASRCADGIQSYRVLWCEGIALADHWISSEVPVKASFLDQLHRHLGEANLVIVQIRARIEQQRRVVAVLDADENRARKAKETQSRLENTLQRMIRGRAFILEDLNRAAVDFDRPEWLRARAIEMRGIADTKIGDVKQLLRRVAQSYERLAKRAMDRPAQTATR